MQENQKTDATHLQRISLDTKYEIYVYNINTLKNVTYILYWSDKEVTYDLISVIADS